MDDSAGGSVSAFLAILARAPPGPTQRGGGAKRRLKIGVWAAQTEGVLMSGRGPTRVPLAPAVEKAGGEDE